MIMVEIMNKVITMMEVAAMESQMFLKKLVKPDLIKRLRTMIFMELI